MFMRAPEVTSPPYPFVGNTWLDIAHEQVFRWGRIRFTEEATEAYAFNFTDMCPVDRPQRPLIEGFGADVLVVGPDELVARQQQPVPAGSAIYRGGSRTTIGLPHDRTMFGFDMASKTLDGLTRDLDPWLTPDFLSDYGEYFQNQSIDKAVPHALSNLAASETASSYMIWRQKHDQRTIAHKLTKANLIGFGSVATIGLIDFMSDGDFDVLPVTFNFAFLAFLAGSSISYLKHELDPKKQVEKAEVGARVARRVHHDLHSLLCPGREEP